MKTLDKLRKVLFPHRFALRQREKEQEQREARWDKLAEEEYQVWQQGGKEAWLAWRKEQAENRREEYRNLIEPAYMKELRKEAIIDTVSASLAGAAESGTRMEEGRQGGATQGLPAEGREVVHKTCTVALTV